MRVLFLTLYPEPAASPRYRVVQFLSYLCSRGVSYTVASPVTEEAWRVLTGEGRRRRAFWYHAHETARRMKQLLDARRYDVVFVQKALMTAYLRGAAAALRWGARRIIYDIDDAVHLAPPHPLRGPWRFVEDRNQIVKVMRMADRVLAGNTWLASEAARLGANVVHFPTVVDTARFVPAADAPDAFRVGWIGNPSTAAYLEPVRKVLESLDGEVCLVGAASSGTPWRRAALRPWSLETEVAELQRLSAGIMPLPRTDWAKGKCALKALQYMACGVPCDATPFGAALDIIRPDENGLFAESPEEWRDALDRLRDPKLRKRLGDAGRSTVEERYSIAKAAPRFFEILESVA